MKLIFLDIDGVLNRIATEERFEGCTFVEPQKILCLQEIVQKTGAEIVLTSTWRRGWYCRDHGQTTESRDLEDIRFFDALQSILREYGLELLGYTDDFALRGREIEKWLQEWKGESIESFVILDDLPEKELEPFTDRLVQTCLHEGLLPEHIGQAIKVLNKRIHQDTWIDGSVAIDFPLPKYMQNLIKQLELLDAAEDYSYFNYSDALDVQAKEMVVQGCLTREQWDLLCLKYCSR